MSASTPGRGNEMKIQTDKLPKIIEWDCEQPGYPVGYVVQYRGDAHQVIDCRAEDQGYRLAALSCPACITLRTRAESADKAWESMRKVLDTKVMECRGNKECPDRTDRHCHGCLVPQIRAILAGKGE